MMMVRKLLTRAAIVLTIGWTAIVAFLVIGEVTRGGTWGHAFFVVWQAWVLPVGVVWAIIWGVLRDKRQPAPPTPVNRWLKSTASSVGVLAFIAAAAFWVWPFSLWQWGMLVAAVFVAFEWGEVVGTCREQLLQAERDRKLPPELRAAVEEALAARARLLRGPERPAD